MSKYCSAWRLLKEVELKQVVSNKMKLAVLILALNIWERAWQEWKACLHNTKNVEVSGLQSLNLFHYATVFKNVVLKLFTQSVLTWLMFSIIQYWDCLTDEPSTVITVYHLIVTITSNLWEYFILFFVHI